MSLFTRREALGTLASVPFATCQFALAQQPMSQNDFRLTYVGNNRYRMKFTLLVHSQGTALRRITATCPIPTSWPEQTVKLVSQSAPQGSRLRAILIAGQAAYLHCSIPYVSAGGTGTVEQIYEIQRSNVRFAGNPQTLKAPETITPELRTFLKSSPGINVADKRLAGLVNQLSQDRSSAWDLVRTFYDWVRNNVRYQLMDYQGAQFAFLKRRGDCEDMTALFVALCRIKKIPARTVWVHEHAYPEFYLEEESGKGVWIPCQISGSEEFGRITEDEVILQKGDSFEDNILNKTSHYVPVSVRAFGGRVKVDNRRTRI